MLENGRSQPRRCRWPRRSATPRRRRSHAAQAPAAPANTLRFFPGFSVEAREDLRRGDQPRARRIGSAAVADARRAADARLDAADRAGAGEGLHGDRPRPARLRRQQQAGRRREPCELFEARDGARSGRGDEEFRLRQVRRRRPRSRRPRRPSHGARSCRTR